MEIARRCCRRGRRGRGHGRDRVAFAHHADAVDHAVAVSQR